MVKMQGSNNRPTLTLYFAFDFSFLNLPTKPHYILSYVLKSTENGTFLAYLQQKRWTKSITTKTYGVGDEFGYFRVSINLTDAGITHYQKIYLLFFEFMATILAEVNKELYEDVKKAYKLLFEQDCKTSPKYLLHQFVENLEFYPSHEVM